MFSTRNAAGRFPSNPRPLSKFLLAGAIIIMSQHAAIASTTSTDTSRNTSAPKAPSAYPTEQEGFQFLEGSWQIHNRKLKEPMSPREEWTEFEASARFFTLLDGLVSVEELRDAKGAPFGCAMRTFDREKRVWSDAWVSARDGVLQLPSFGSFVGDVATFITEDTYNDKPVLARGLWRRVSKDHVIWEQALSTDKGATWQTNWIMNFRR